MSRPKGFKLTEEQKAKMKEGRLAAKQVKSNTPVMKEKPTLVISGYEETGFDYWPKLRKLLRPIHQYSLLKKIEREIVEPSIWTNKRVILDILEKYLNLSETGEAPKKKKERKKSDYVMTPEHKEKMRLAREAKKNG